MGVDYFVNSTSISFAAGSGASNRAESCITVTAICDSEEEGDEMVTIAFILNEMFTIGNGDQDVLPQAGIILVESNNSGNKRIIILFYMCVYVGLIVIITLLLNNNNIVITETSELCPVVSPSPPRNLHQSTPDSTPSTTIEWNAPVFTGGNGVSIESYRITIPAVMGYSEEESGTAHTITADGSDVMFNTLYDVEVTAVNSDGQESSPARVYVNITENGEHTAQSKNVNRCIIMS